MSHLTSATSQNSPGSQSVQPQRAAKACLACRNRKTRCDGERPACRACQKRGISNSCNYHWVNRRQLRRSAVAGDCKNTNSPPANGSSNYGGTVSPSTGTTRDGDLPTASIPESDGIPALAGPHDPTSYGSASMVAFHRYITSPDNKQEPSQGNAIATSAPKRPRPSRSMALLPRRTSADDLVYCFFQYYQPVYPVLHRPDFQKQYERLWTTSTEDEGTEHGAEEDDAAFVATLNLVFAIGSRISPSISISEKRSVPDDFYRRARELFPYDLLASSSFAVLQMLLLMALYLQATHYSAECWNSLGLAIRVAQSLGLHADGDKDRPLSSKDLNLRRQVWHLCVQMDSLFSIAYGRPLVIESTNVPLPETIDDEPVLVSSEILGSDSAISKYGAFIQTSFLFKLLRQIIKDVYQPEEASKFRPSALLNKAMSINGQIDEFTQSLPTRLRYLGLQAMPSTQDGPVRLQQQVLARRTLFLKLVLFRPFISLSDPNSEDAGERGLQMLTQSSLEQDLVRQYCQSCLKVAYQLSEITFEHLGDPYCSTGWHNTHFAFCCSLVLLSAYKSPYLRSHVGANEYEMAWRHCMSILEYYHHILRSASNSRQVLLAVREQLRQNGPAQEEPTSNSRHGKVPARAQDDGLANDAANAMNGIVIPETAGSQLPTDFSVEDLLSFNFDLIDEAWLNQYLPDLDLPELFPTG